VWDYNVSRAPYVVKVAFRKEWYEELLRLREGQKVCIAAYFFKFGIITNLLFVDGEIL